MVKKNPYSYEKLTDSYKIFGPGFVLGYKEYSSRSMPEESIRLLVNHMNFAWEASATEFAPKAPQETQG